MSVASLLKKELRHIARQEVARATIRLNKTNRRLGKLTRLVRKQTSALRALQVRQARVQGKRRLRLTAARRAALKVQGRYMGYLRMLTANQKKRVKAVKANRGYAPAIALAKRLGSR
jgi:hypothetical protein